MPKKNTPNRPNTLIVLLIGGLLLIAAGLYFALGMGERGTPRLVVEPASLDYGIVHFGEEKTFTLTLLNTGDGTLRFKEAPYIEVLEGC